jgi:hypothetical protein
VETQTSVETGQPSGQAGNGGGPAP